MQRKFLSGLQFSQVMNKDKEAPLQMRERGAWDDQIYLKQLTGTFYNNDCTGF